MKSVKGAAVVYAAAIFAAAIGGRLVAPYDYAEQFRHHIAEPPSSQFVLGTDDLGRDRLSRLLMAIRVSLMLAPGMALLTTAMGACLGVLAALGDKLTEGAILTAADLFLSLPLLLLILTLRALLPLGSGSAGSIAALAAVLILAGWPSSARVVRGALRELPETAYIVQARAYGASPMRVARVHMLAQLRPLLAAQFWTLIPVFLIAEANLGILGLGVSEPLPTLGNLLAELRDFQRISESPWILAPAGVLVTLLTALHFMLSGGD